MFWDSSALIPLLFREPRSAELSSLLASDPEPVMWWATPVECQSAIYRRHRERPLPLHLLHTALGRLVGLVEDLDAVSPSEQLRGRAGKLLADYPLRAADSLQLAAALVWADQHPGAETFISLDERLLDAAGGEGFTVLPHPPQRRRS